MPTRAERYQQLSDAVREFLFDDAKQQVAKEQLVKGGVATDGVFAVLLLAENIILGEQSLKELESHVAQTTKLEPEKVKTITRDLIGYRLLPLEKFVPGVLGELRRLGGDPSSYPGERIQKPIVTGDEFLQFVLATLNIPLVDSSLKSRLEYLLSAYIHGSRTKEQTIAILSRSTKVGGIELSEDEGKKLLAVVDEKKSEYEIGEKSIKNASTSDAELEQNQSQEQVVENSRQEEQAKKTDKNKDLAQKEQEVLTKKYVALTGKVPVGSLVAPPMPLTRVSAAVSKEEELAKINKRVDATAKAVVQQVAPKPIAVLPKLSPESLPPVKVGDRPDVADIKYTQKLVGPLEELNRMGLLDFHQLASNPNQATMKIKDKIDLLAQDSYEKKIAGIKAWRESSVNRLYVSMMGEALANGKPIAQIAQEWMMAGKEALTAEEIKAIVQLNTSLKF